MFRSRRRQDPVKPRARITLDSVLTRARTHASGQSGIGLVEVLVTALLVALIGTAVASALTAGAQTTGDQRNRSRAAALAQLDQERLRGLSALQLTDLAPPNQQSRTVTLGGIPYTITSTANFLNSTGGSACGSTGAGAAAYYEVISSVSWPPNRRSNVTMTSQITPPAGGTLLVMTEDQTGAALPGVTVNASGAGSASGVTDTQGCAIFGDLTSGDYTLGLTDAGYVDDNDKPANPLTISATVTSTGTATPSGGNPIRLGLAGTFTSTFWYATASGQTSTSGGTTGQQADSVAWFGTGSADSMAAYKQQGYNCGSIGCAPTGTSGATVPSAGSITLYPFAFVGPPVSYTGNYHVWAGSCRQEEPPAGTDVFNVTPGSAQALAIQEPGVSLITTYNGSRVAPADIMFKFTQGGSAPGAACTHKWSTAVAATAATGTNALATPGQPFASTATTGSTASASGLTGTLSVCVDYKPGGGTLHYLIPASFQNTNFAAVTSLGTLVIPTTNAAKGSCASNF
jgi:hypothetical protein